jgi:hypothetical protein
MAGGEDWLFRPVLAGLCTLKELEDGSYTLADVVDMNDALDVKDENERRYYEAMKREPDGR